MSKQPGNYEHPNKLAIAVGDQVRQAREEAKLSQSQLAKMVGVRRPTITNIENGKATPSLETLVLLATILEKPIDYFVTYVPREWKVPEGSLTTEERLLLIKFRDIKEPRDIALTLYLIDAIAKFSIDEFLRVMTRVEDDLPEVELPDFTDKIDNSTK